MMPLANHCMKTAKTSDTKEHSMKCSYAFSFSTVVEKHFYGRGTTVLRMWKSISTAVEISF